MKTTTEKWGAAQLASARDYNCKDRDTLRQLDDELADSLRQIESRKTQYGSKWADAKISETRTEALAKAKEIMKGISARTELISAQSQFHSPQYWQRNQWLTRPLEALTAAHTDWFPEQVATLKSHAKLLEALSILVENSTKSATLADLQTCDADMFENYLQRALDERNYSLLGLCQAAARSRQYSDKTEELSIKTGVISTTRDIEPPEGEAEIVADIEAAELAARACGDTFEHLVHGTQDVERHVEANRPKPAEPEPETAEPKSAPENTHGIPKT